MPLKNYGVLKASVIDRRIGSGRNPHFQILVVDDSAKWRLAVNVESQMSPSEVEYLILDPLRHPVTAGLPDLKPGFHALESKPGGLAIDFIRGNLIPDFRDMIPLPYNVPGPDNDLNEKLDAYIQRAMADEDASIYVFGESWGPEDKADKTFAFKPGQGVHDIHMNQGNSGAFVRDDGPYQDGALLFHFPARDTWVGVFLKFQSQAIHTDDKTGHTIADGEGGPPSDKPDPQPTHGDLPTATTPDGWVRIVSALVNDIHSPEQESVTLLNSGPEDIDLTGWAIANKQKEKFMLSGTISAGRTGFFNLSQDVPLSNRGGIISLLNTEGIKVHGVSYTREQAQHPGWTITF